MKMIKSMPLEGTYFKEHTLDRGNAPEKTELCVVNVFDEFEYQDVIGFGGAFTEAAAYNYSLLTDAQKKQFMEAYFDREKGIAYNFGRCHIGSCDFSLNIYSNVEEGDDNLENFSIERDRKYIIPFIKDALKYTGEDLMLFASPWSPPAFMKTNNSEVLGGSLKKEYRRLWARCYAKFIKAYAAEGITISAITVQNEPIAVQTWESCYYSAEDERDFIEEALAPVLDEEGLGDIKLLIWDHNKERTYDRAKQTFTSAAVEKRVWGIAHHWYSGDHFDTMRLVHEKFNKPMISSEICGVMGPMETAVDLAEKYAREICGDFANFTGGFCDWNLLLDENGGPYHNRTWNEPAEGPSYEDKSIGCFAPIIYDKTKGELILTPIYYYVGHFSKFVSRGAKRIATSKYCEELQVCGFKNPNGELVLVVANIGKENLPVVVRHNSICTKTDLEAHTIATFIL